jgi:FAD/FMN-containing dehydrogenase
MVRTARLLVLAIAVVAVGVVAPPLIHLTLAWRADQPHHEVFPDDWLIDASRLDPTPIQGVVRAPASADAAIAPLRAALERARQQHLGVSIGGARHSMGGQTVAPEGLYIDMSQLAEMTLLDGDVLRVGAGALWREVVPFLDARGRSPAVMQSDNDFSVGGSVSVGAHGWQPGRPPISASVRRLRVMTADGTVRWCSRSQDRALFRHVLGGYGLFGIILEAELETVPNATYRFDVQELSLNALVAAFPQRAWDPSVGMAFARLDVRRSSLFESGLLTRFHRVESPPGGPASAQAPGLARLRRVVFRGSVGSDYGKWLRWHLERLSGWAVDGEHTTRNTQLSDTSRTVIGYERHHTDILHEYFVEPDAASAYLADVRDLVLDHGAELLNVTMRDVRADPDMVLTYATTDVAAFVMLFHQPRTRAGEAAMRAFTQDMIDTALRHGGRYYLPYRLHGTPEQLRQAYPMWDEFVSEKRRWDPDGLFVNRLWLAYAD